MVHIVTVLAAAAAVSPAVATGGHGKKWNSHWNKKWAGAGSYNTPNNSKNNCDIKYAGGLEFGNIGKGKVDTYGGFKFNGWTCEDDKDKNKGRVIAGDCGDEEYDNPSLSHDDKFTVKKFKVFPEFDCKLEFHYTLADGGSCKSWAHCSSKGTEVENTQCAGATKVKVVFPKQNNQSKCRVKIPRVDFECNDNTTPEPPVYEPPTEPSYSAPGEEPTYSEPSEEPTYSEPSEEPTYSVPGEEPSYTTPPTEPTYSAPGEEPTYSAPGEEPTYSAPGEEPTYSEPSEEPTYSAPGEEPTYSEPSEEPTYSEPSEEPSYTQPGDKPVSSESPETPDDDEPETELPCPEVVPKCVKTWLHLVEKCKNTLDASCFCPSEDFIKKTYECLGAHGESGDVIAKAADFLQGLCAPYIPENPAIVTCIDDVTDDLTITGTPIVPDIPYTTVVVEATVTVPCVTDGTTIPGSSTIKTIHTEVTVPNVEMPTAPSADYPAPTTGDESPEEQPEAPAPTGGPDDEYAVPPPAVEPPHSTMYEVPGGNGTAPPEPIPEVPSPEVPTAGAASVSFGLGLALVAALAAL